LDKIAILSKSVRTWAQLLMGVTFVASVSGQEGQGKISSRFPCPVLSLFEIHTPFRFRDIDFLNFRKSSKIFGNSNKIKWIGP